MNGRITARRVYEIAGVVQGVGFRPAVHRLATAARLGGTVRNCAGSVRLTLEGTPGDIDAFVARLPAALPPHIAIARIAHVADEAPAGEGVFSITESDTAGTPAVLIPPDVRVCDDCIRDVRDHANRRHGYAFTTCTVCGPRYTVCRAMPYDRSRTSMAAFPPCSDCAREYADPADRRFHAETIACAVCGPRLTLLDGGGRPVAEEPMQGARRLLREGRVVAVRGIGGFQLAVDATNPVAVAALRERKLRPAKPLAIMASGIEAVRRVCRVTDGTAALLESREAPIVVLDLLPDARAVLPVDVLSPDTATLGVMLPTSPLHVLLFEPQGGGVDYLVMTSGNRGGEPICVDTAEAVSRLAGIADAYLTHNRDIVMRTDDSIRAISAGAPQVWRRARGFTPTPVRLGHTLARTVMAMGAELKNAVALGYGGEVILSPHVGDLDTAESVDGLNQAVSVLRGFLARTPDVVAVDLHPDMHATRAGETLAASLGVPVVRVQHHEAHAVACLAEHGLREGLAIVFDGTGFGADESIWGAELFDVSPAGVRRLGSFAPVPLPGGDAAVQEPVRQVVGRFAAYGLDLPAGLLERFGVAPDAAAAWDRQARGHINAPLSGSAGRVFDSFAAMLGFAPRRITYEAQAAVRLEAAAARWSGQVPELPCAASETDGRLVIDWKPAFAAVADAVLTGQPADQLAAACHRAVARAAAAMVDFAFSVTARRTVALSGGCFMNRELSAMTVELLGQRHARVVVHRETPPNDGCIALGQAVVAGGAR